jgi:hypothetical protein
VIMTSFSDARISHMGSEIESGIRIAAYRFTITPVWRYLVWAGRERAIEDIKSAVNRELR